MSLPVIDKILLLFTLLLYAIGSILQLGLLARKVVRILRRSDFRCWDVVCIMRRWMFPDGPLNDAVRAKRLRNMQQYVDGFAFVYLFVAIIELREVLTKESCDAFPGCQAASLISSTAVYAACCLAMAKPEQITLTRVLWLCWAVMIMAAFGNTFREGRPVPIQVFLLVFALETRSVLLITSMYLVTIVAFVPLTSVDVHVPLGAPVMATVMSIVYNFALRLQCAETMRLQTSEDAGEALCSLLHAEYDALIELDECLCITHASKTFFGMISVLPPSDNSSSSTQLLRIMPQQSSCVPPPQKAASLERGSVDGRYLPRMLAQAEDERVLRKCLEEQAKCWCPVGSSLHEDSQPRTPAVVTVCFRVHRSVTVRLHLYCTACFNQTSRQYRHIIAIRQAEEVAQRPAAQLGWQVEAPPAPDSRDVFFAVFNFASPGWPLLVDTARGAEQLHAGEKLESFFTPCLFSRMFTFVTNKVADYRLGAVLNTRWVFGVIAGGPSDNKPIQVFFEWSGEAAGAVAIAIRMTRAFHSSRGSRGSRGSGTSSGSAASRPHFEPSLNALPEGHVCTPISTTSADVSCTEAGEEVVSTPAEEAAGSSALARAATLSSREGRAADAAAMGLRDCSSARPPALQPLPSASHAQHASEAQPSATQLGSARLSL